MPTIELFRDPDSDRNRQERLSAAFDGVPAHYLTEEWSIVPTPSAPEFAFLNVGLVTIIPIDEVNAIVNALPLPEQATIRVGTRVRFPFGLDDDETVEGVVTGIDGDTIHVATVGTSISRSLDTIEVIR